MADNLNEKHDWSQPGDRSAEVFEVMCTVMLDSNNMCRNEHDDSASRCGIDIGGWRKEAGNQADQVGDQNEYCQRCNQGKERTSMLTHGLDNHVLYTTDDDFHEVLESTGDCFDHLGCQYRKYEQQADNEPGVANCVDRRICIFYGLFSYSMWKKQRSEKVVEKFQK